MATVNVLEAAAATLGLVNILLVIRRSIWNFPFGLAMVALYGWLFAQPSVRLYSQAALQLFFAGLQVYGWWSWSRARETESGPVQVRALPARGWWVCIALILGATAAWGAAMHRFTSAAQPWWDAFIAMASIAAQLLMARRFVESWRVWIAVDLVAIGLYAREGLALTAVLYVLFLGLSIWGLVGWRRALAA